MNIDAIAVAADLENEALEQIDPTLLDWEVVKGEDIKLITIGNALITMITYLLYTVNTNFSIDENKMAWPYLSNESELLITLKSPIFIWIV